MRSRRGSVLVVTLFVGSALGLAVLSMSLRASVASRAASDARRVQHAEDIAESALALSFDALAQDDDRVDALTDAWATPRTMAEVARALGMPPGEAEHWTLEAAIEDEHAKRLVSELGEESAAALGLSTERVDALLDWCDADDQPRRRGQESPVGESVRRGTRAKNARLESLSELSQVAGFAAPRGDEPSDARTLSAVLTTWTDGRVNLNTASAAVLRSLPLEEATVLQIVKARESLDTAWASIADVRGHISDASASDIALLEQAATFRSSHFLVRVRVRHTLSGITVARRIVVARAGRSVRALEWSDETP